MGKGILYLPALGRLLLSGLFIWAGYAKLMNPGGTTQYFISHGVPAAGIVVWLSVLIELVGGIALLVGFKTRWVAAIIGIWCLITGFAVHLPLGMNGDAMALDNMVHFYKNLAMAGGFAYVTAFGAGKLSVDMGT